MCAAECPNEKMPDNDDRQESCRYPGTDCYPDSLLDAMLSGLIFFDTEGIIFRTNTTARKDLHLADSVAGCKLGDVCSIDFRGSNILADLLSRFQDPAVTQVPLTQDALLCTKDGKVSFFAAGRISRLERGHFVFAYRNTVDEMTNESMINIALSVSKIFPWFYDFEQQTMIIDQRYFDYTGIPTKDCTMTLEAFAERLHPDDRAAMAHAFALQLSGVYYPHSVPFRLRRGDDTYEWFEGQSAYLGQLKNMPYRIVGESVSFRASSFISRRPPSLLFHGRRRRARAFCRCGSSARAGCPPGSRRRTSRTRCSP